MRIAPAHALLFGLTGLFACSDDGAPGEARPAPGVRLQENVLRATADPSRPRHVLLIVIDTLRADHLSCYGYWRQTSPNIDQMAQRGVLFRRAISQSSWTSPSMVTLMTGQRLSRRRLTVPDDTPTLAELFKDAGYRTGAFVSNPLLSPKNGFDRGFERWVEQSLVNVDDVTEWLLENAGHDTFTWVHFTDPHDPYQPPLRLRSNIPGKLRPQTEELLRAAVEEEGFGDHEAQRAFMAQQVGLYDDEITAVDKKVRRLLGTLHETNNLDNAIVALTSDHGECLWERRETDPYMRHAEEQRGTPSQLVHRLKQRHGEFVFQELVQVPLIILAPGLERERIVDSVAEAVHLPATLLALAGVEVEGVELMEGRNLFGEPIPPGAYTMTNQGEAFVSEDGWKLIRPTREGELILGLELQLFDLRADPEELVNLAAEHPDVVERLARELVARRNSAIALDTSFDQDVEDNLDELRKLGYLGDIIEAHDEHGQGAPAAAGDESE